MLTNQTRATVVQVLQSLSRDAASLLILKHFDIELAPSTGALLEVLALGRPESVAGLLVELVGGRTAIRTDAPTKYVFDGRLAELRGRLRADGFEVVEDALVRLLPGAEPAAYIADSLEQTLRGSDVDGDSEIRRLLRESHADIGATPPDFNGGTTKARVALETVARRAAIMVATRRRKAPPTDSWGPALAFLRSEGVIAQAEEDALAKVYTLISPGAHVPRGLTDEQWALLARTFAVSGAYFLTRQYLAA